METILILVGVFTVLGGIWIAGRYLEQQRAEQMRLEGESLGFEYQPQDFQGVLDGLPAYELTRRGRRPKYTNVLRRETGQATVTVFDYCYTTGSSQSTARHQQTVLRLQSEFLGLPQFVVRPRHLLDKLKAVLGLPEIDFSAHPTFSSRYVLQGADPERIREVFTLDVLAFFERNRGWSVEGRETHLIAYRGGKRVKPNELRDFYERGVELLLLLRSR